MSERIAVKSPQPAVARGSPATPWRRQYASEKRTEAGGRTTGGSSANASPAVAVPPIAQAVLRSSGSALDPALRSLMETRFRHDFSRVRIHNDARADASARALDAQAYAAGRDIVFAAGRYAPWTAAGMRLLAHELAHVVQQGDVNTGSHGLFIGATHDAAERAADAAAAQVSEGGVAAPLAAAPARLRRQPNTPTAARGTGAPAFSVDQTRYLAQVTRAIAGISGAIVESNTAAAQVRPVLQAMLAQVVWRDQAGSDHGGGTATYTWPFGAMPALRLKLVLDDQASPPDAGHFESRGSSDATIFVRIRKNPDADALQLTLYHESMHFLRWANSVAVAASAAPRRRGAHAAAGPAPSSPTARALAHGSAPALATTVGRWLDQLKDSVNAHRASGDQLGSADVRFVTDWLIEEVQVRAETEIFRLASSVQAARAGGGPSVIVGTAENIDVNRAMVDRYLFEFSGRFRAADRAALTPYELQSIDVLARILEGFFQHQVRRRISLSAYAQIPRTPISLPPTPLTQPPFPPLPLPP